MRERKEFREKHVNSTLNGSKKIGKRLFLGLAYPLLSLTLIACPAARAEKIKNPESAPAIVKRKALESGWSGGTCIFNENEWSITYETENEINGKKEATINLNKLDGVGTPEKIICDDMRSYLITPTHVLITLGGVRAFEDQVMLGMVGGELVAGNVMGLDISQITKQGILLNLIVDDKLYLFTKIGTLWEVPLTSSPDASCAFTAKYPPMGKMAIMTYKGLVVLIKEGNETVVLIESTEDKFKRITYESDGWVKGKISVSEEKDCLKIRIGKKEYRIEVGEDGNVKSATVEEKDYKEKEKNKK